MRRLLALFLVAVLTLFLNGCKNNHTYKNDESKNRIKAIFTSSAPKPIGTYSQAIQSHHTIYISGQIGLDSETMLLVSGTLESQIRQVFDNISAIIKASGGTMADVTKLTIYITDLNSSNKVYEIMGEYFKPPYPARALVAVSALPKRAKIEIDAIAEINTAL